MTTKQEKPNREKILGSIREIMVIDFSLNEIETGNLIYLIELQIERALAEQREGIVNKIQSIRNQFEDPNAQNAVGIIIASITKETL